MTLPCMMPHRQKGSAELSRTVLNLQLPILIFDKDGMSCKREGLNLMLGAAKVSPLRA